MLEITSRIIATCFALVSFAAAMVVGMVAGNDTSTIILRATLLMLIAWLVGRAVGEIAQRTMDEHIRQYKLDHPIAPETEPSDDVPVAVDVEEDVSRANATESV